MKILCDQNMPYAVEAFRTLGEVSAKDGREITAADVRDVDLLFTRSTTKVNAALLDGSRVRFYGSAVIGVNHIDIPYLEARGIPWTPAPGCNAESVANYITAALFFLGGKFGFTLARKTVGVIGVGNVGRRVVRHLRSLGMNVLANDPPRQLRETTPRPDLPLEEDATRFVSLDELLAVSDVITVHTPLEKGGDFPTFHLLDASAIAKMKPGVIVCNAARGAIVETDALLAAKEEGRIAHLVIDCWEGEPAYRRDLAAVADVETPHIAGHSFEGKVNGTAMVYRKACAFLGVPATFPFELPPPPLPVWRADAGGVVTEAQEEAFLRPLVLRVYDIEADDRRFRETDSADAQVRAKGFDRLRGNYPMRRQFDATRVELLHATPRLLAKLAGLGFQGVGAPC